MLISHPKKTRIQKQDAEQPFWLHLEEMLRSAELHELEEGYLRGSLSGESWKAFLKSVRDEVLEGLGTYRRESENTSRFCASGLESFREEKRKMQRAYLRNLVFLYKNTERAYKSAAG